VRIIRFGRPTLVRAALVALLSAGAITVVTPGPASAEVTCNSMSFKPAGLLDLERHVPTRGAHTGNMNCSLGPGNRSLAVYVLQEALYSCYNELPDVIQLDGIYGDQTRRHLRAAQRKINRMAGRHVLDEDGLYGPATRARLSFAIFEPNGGPMQVNLC
jgi:peptidoglycan hydrolase-like protein with peptidoglycan-binding domain